MERTLSIIKPDAVEKHIIGKIINRFEEEGFTILNLKMLSLTTAQAENFYGIHKERPFFNDLVTFMTSGPVVIIALERDNAVLLNRDIMGATNPKEAAKGTLRAEFADSIDANIVHGSDSIENANIELQFFFPELAS